MNMKTCKNCNQPRLEKEFRIDSYKDKLYLRKVCKSCEYKRINPLILKYRAKRKEFYTEYNRKYQLSYSKLPEVRIKNKAKRTTRTALENGSLKKMPCEVCKSKESQAHHPDYSRPLYVIWLCRKHHEELHHKQAEGV